MRTPKNVVRVVAIGAVSAIGAIVPISVAAAADYPAGGTPPEVSPASKTPTSQTPTVVAGRTATRSTLPFTGTDVVELSAIAGVSVGLGLVMVRRSRRASTT